MSSELVPVASLSTAFRYFLACPSEVVEEGGSLWRSVFPLSRNPQKTGDAEPAGMALTYGDYFEAVRQFLENREFRVVTSAILEAMQQPVTARDISAIDIFLVKHGQFYHPSRVEVLAMGQVFTFVVNVALSFSGKSCIEREFYLLNRLGLTPSDAYLPKAYGYGEVILPKGQEVKLFLGEWFDDFHEFHISEVPKDQQYKIRVWHANPASRFLTPGETLELYRQIAMILTGCYDPESFEQVFPWHHAAGDFIVRCSNGSLQIKLITVRQYGALLENPDKDEITLLEAMLFFLVNLSIRTRLDRLDGVGEVVWAGMPAVDGTVRGFMDGLSAKVPRWDLRFKKFLAAVSLLELREICEAVADSYHPLAPELPVVRDHLAAHAAEVFASLKAFSV
ncbi:MAG: hypothetical protein NTU74_06240 [Deltaproteobacteria bacterium]|nr:hypothetical protein [Deltaproteobacteria bacterium]